MSEDIYGDAYEAFIDEIYKNGGGEPSAVRAAVDCATKSLRALLREAREYTGYAAFYGDRIEADHATDLCARIDSALNKGGEDE